jgi:hypothetical protein
MRVPQGSLSGAIAALLLGAVAVGGPWAGAALGQGDTQIVTGNVVDQSGNQMTVGANSGPVQVQTSGATVYEKEGRGSVFQIMPGQLVGVTSRPDPDGAYALQVRIVPAALSGVSRGQRPMEGPNLGNTMTNAVVESLVNDMLTLSNGSETYQIRVSTDTEVLMPVPATAADVTNGTRVAATGTRGADGTLQATMINVLGPPGGGATAALTPGS